MKNNLKKVYKEILLVTAKYIRESVNLHLPEGVQKDFMLWALADTNPCQRDYLRMLGVGACTTLGISLLNINDDQASLKKLIHYAALMNVYAAFEGSSDNIEFGLANRRVDNEIYPVKKDVMVNFNKVMIKKLQGDPRSTIEFLIPYEKNMRVISAYQQSLHPSEFYQLAEKYCKLHENINKTELEYSILSTLIINVEACLNLTVAMQDHLLYDYLKEGLIERYRAVNSQITGENLKDLGSLVELGTKSILIMQMLAFCVGALDKTAVNVKLAEVMADGSLKKIFYSAALQVRLLNDFGTELLSLNNDKLNKYFDELRLNLLANKNMSIYEFLANASKINKYLHLMTRIRKDLELGEFNICLDNLQKINSTEEALEQFFKNIVFCSELYQQHQNNFTSELADLAHRINDDKIGKVIFNFVSFHKKIYEKKFEASQGDFMFYDIGRKST